MAIILILLFLLPPCNHPSTYDAYISARALPVHITYVDNEKIEYRYEDNQQVVLGAVYPSDRTVFAPNFKKEWDSHRWVIYYCERHFTLYSIKEIK